MQTEPAAPAWSEETSASFIAYGRFFNPERERQFEVIGDLAASAAAGDAAPLFVELCSGAGDLAAHLLGRFAGARYIAYDGSPAMLAETARQCAPFRGRLEEMDRAPRATACIRRASYTMRDSSILRNWKALPRSSRQSVVPRWVQRLNSARIFPFESRSRMIGRSPSFVVM